jgi:hypothetical protein
VNPKSFVILVASSPSRHVDFVHVVNAREALASKKSEQIPCIIFVVAIGKGLCVLFSVVNSFV